MIVENRSINQKLSVLMQIKAENYKLKIELNGLKKRNECLEVDVQQMQNNTKNENQKFTSLPSTYNLTSEVKINLILGRRYKIYKERKR